MRIGIISDIHGNAEAFQAVMRKLIDADQIFCLGDIVGYGADPVFCLNQIRQLGIPSLKGNHEGALTGELDLNSFNDVAILSTQWTKKLLDPSDFMFIQNLKKKLKITRNILGVHGSPRQPLLEYVLDKQTAEEIFTGFDFKVYFIGHSHIAGYFSYHKRNQTIRYDKAVNGGLVPIKKDNSYIVNCGSVGQPRDGNPQASYAIFDTDRMSVNLLRVDYPFTKTQSKIIEAALPAFLAERLALGI